MLNDLDLHVDCFQIVFARASGLLKSRFVLCESLALVPEPPLSRQRAYANQARKHNQHGQFWFLMLHAGFALLQCDPFLFERGGTHHEFLPVRLS